MARRYFIPSDLSLPYRLYARSIERRRPVPEFPRIVQIETQLGCPARCIFCPNSSDPRRGPRDLMPLDLYQRLVDECVDGGAQRISPYLRNEPLMDRSICEKIAYIARRRDAAGSKTVIKINSNAALLDERIARALLDSGLDRVSFSVHGIIPEIYERTMIGLRLDKVLRNIDRFLELKRAGNYPKPRVRVTMVKTKYLEPQIPEILRYWGERNVKVNIRGLENRADTGVETEMKKFNTRGWAAYSWCTRLFEQAYIVSTGQLVLCCVDWRQTAVMGDASNGATIRSIWNGPAYLDIRRRFLSGRLEGTLCATCLKERVEGDEE